MCQQVFHHAGIVFDGKMQVCVTPHLLKRIRAVLDQKKKQIRLVGNDRLKEWGVCVMPIIRHDIGIGAMLKETLHEMIVAPMHRGMKEGVSVFIWQIDITAIGKPQGQRFAIPMMDFPVQ
jgi:hypothetical protein